MSRRWQQAWLATLLAASCGTAWAEPIKIGVTVAQSAPGSVVQGTQVKDGLEIAQQMLNDAGGVLDRQIELVVEDTQGTPDKAAAAVETLITRDHVVAIVGEHQSSAALAGIEVAHRHHIPYINTNGWSDAIREKGYAEVFNPSNYNSRAGAAAAAAFAGLGARSVVAFAENTDYGTGLAKIIGERLKAVAPEIRYSYVTLDRTSHDFQAAMAPLRHDLPDVLVNIMLPPAAYAMIGQVYEQGIAPTGRTFFYDAAGIADYPDFWENVAAAGNGMLVYGLYHPGMNTPLLGKQVAEAYIAKTQHEPNRLLFQAVDSLLLLADAIKRAGSTDADPVIKALEAAHFTGTRGTITFSTEPGYTFHQWVEVPYVTYQITAENQRIGDTTLIEQPGAPFDKAKVWRAMTY
ncbi:MAG TPA: ABC transporter substrate-binding protein [Aliidongia sp.]|nr:ABC transporter substrate-binding protein [Aliidongia sp.]